MCSNSSCIYIRIVRESITIRIEILDQWLAYFYMLTPEANLYVILSLIRKLQCYQTARSLKLIGAFRSFLHNERTVFFAKAITLSELAPVLQCTWLLYSNIWVLRSLSWRATLLVTTRRQESFPVTFSLLSVMTRSWTNFWPVSQSHREVFFLTSKLYFCPRRPRRNPRHKSALTHQKRLL